MSDNSEMQKDNLILPTFIIMLLDVANLIFEKMSPMDLLTTRKVSRDLRTAVDKFGIRFYEIRVITYEYSQSIFIRFDETEIEYSIHDDGGTKVTHKRKTWKTEEENYMERAFKDLKPVLQSNYITLSLEKYGGNSNSYDNVFPSLIAWLESEKCVPVECVRLSGFTFDEVLTILPYVDVEALQVIHLYDVDQIDRFERITHLDQWKSNIMFILLLPLFNIDQIELLFQIESFVVRFDEFSVHNAIKIRDDLMKRSTFNKCEIRFDASKIHRENIANVFDLDSTRRYPWRFKYSNDQDSFWIRITVNDKYSEYALCVNRIESSKMQQPTSPNLAFDVVDQVAQMLEHMHRNTPQKSNNCSKMQPSLLEMPLDVAGLVFEKMKPMDLLTTRKVCRDFRAAVDHFGVRFDRIDFEMYDYRIEMNLDEECITYFDAGSLHSTMAYEERKTVVESENYLEMAFNDLKLVLKCAPILNICNKTVERDDIMITSFIDVLEKEECIHVKRNIF